MQWSEIECLYSFVLILQTEIIQLVNKEDV